jgi:hypothetical protein
MIVAVTRALAIALVAMAAAACRSVPQEPLQLDGNMLTVDNRTPREWKNVEVWLNTYYRVTTASIPPNTRFQTPLDNFVAGFGQRFQFRRMQVRDLRLTATLPDGKPLELKKAFVSGGLDALKERP